MVARSRTFADQQHVGASAQRVGERIASRIVPDLALVDHATLVADQIFDGIFDGEDVAGRAGIAMIDHCRERRRLAGAGGADHQNQAAFFQGKVEQYRRQVQRCKRTEYCCRM